MNIELVKLIINPNIAFQTCFLCFKQHEYLSNINSELTIIKDDQEFTVTVSKMVSHLFCLKETILQQVCDKCTDLVLSIYILIQKHTLMKGNLMRITQDLEKELSSVNNSGKNCYLRIHKEEQISINEILNNESEFNKKLQECTKCNMNFDTKDQIHEHNKIVHKNTNEAVICHICGKNCSTPASLKSHLNCHKEKQCPYCSKLLKTHSHYKIHVQNHIASNKRQRNQTSYNCNSCSFVSLNKGSLEAHINKVHLGIRPHVCSICYKGFFKKSNLTEHVKIHNKVKTETCEVCGDSFVSKKTLLEHIRLHKNQKPYQCDICLKTFVTSGRRSDHVKRKHLEKTECCLICNKMFSLKKELNRHVKKSHWQCEPQFVEHFDNSKNAETMMPMP